VMTATETPLRIAMQIEVPMRSTMACEETGAYGSDSQWSGMETQ